MVFLSYESEAGGEALFVSVAGEHRPIARE